MTRTASAAIAIPGAEGLFLRMFRSACSAAIVRAISVDSAFDHAVKAGCTVRMQVMDMFWGDRFGQVIDPFGHTWAMATHKEDVAPEEMGRRQHEFFARMRQAGAAQSD